MISQNSQKEILYTNNFIEVAFYKEGFLYVDWKGYLSVAQVKEGCELILRIMLETQCFYSINDNRKVKVIKSKV